LEMTPRMLVRNEGIIGDGAKMVIDGVEEFADGPKNRKTDARARVSCMTVMRTALLRGLSVVC
jgi:hypothetical protein